MLLAFVVPDTKQKIECKTKQVRFRIIRFDLPLGKL